MHQLGLIAADDSPRARPAAIAIAASTVNWQVNALVEATPISGPGTGRQHGVGFARDGRFGTLTTESV